MISPPQSQKPENQRYYSRALIFDLSGAAGYLYSLSAKRMNTGWNASNIL
jgi:hypothetical protein